MYVTPFLFYGPSAFEEATNLASKVGFLLDPVGRDGLKVQDSRDLVTLALEGVVGESAPSVVVGPLDTATVEAADALLKTLEETEGTRLLNIVLWAGDINGVRPTVQSRCHCVWSLGDNEILPSPSHPDSQDFVDLYVSGSYPKAMALLLEQEDWVGFVTSVTEAVALEFKSCSDASKLKRLNSLWGRCKPLLGSGNLGVVVAVSRLFCGIEP